MEAEQDEVRFPIVRS